MEKFFYDNYFKIKKVAEGCTTEEHIYAVDKMRRNFINLGEIKIDKLSHSLNIFNFYSIYRKYNKVLKLYNDICDELDQIVEDLVTAYNQALQEHELEVQKAEEESKFYKKFMVTGFQPPKKKKRKNKKKKDE